MERLKHDVDHLAGIQFQDIAALNAGLSTRLSPIRLRDEVSVRTGEGGSLAGIALRSVELRSAQDDPSHATLVLEFPSSSLVFEDAPWPDAVLYPPRPDAPDSSAYWLLKTDSTTLVFGLARDQKHLSYISISKR